MLYILQTALELGFLYAPVALALFLSYRILDIADLTTDGAFTLGAAVSVTVCAAGHPILAVPLASSAPRLPALSPPCSRPSWASPLSWRALLPTRGFIPST